MKAWNWCTTYYPLKRIRWVTKAFRRVLVMWWRHWTRRTSLGRPVSISACCLTQPASGAVARRGVVHDISRPSSRRNAFLFLFMFSSAFRIFTYINRKWNKIITEKAKMKESAVYNRKEQAYLFRGSCTETCRIRNLSVRQRPKLLISRKSLHVSI
jgi:hypothetical protein